MGSHSPLALWHLLSLDAPTVAVLWTYFVAQSSGLRLPASSLVAMFSAVWILYAADRLLDARLLDARLLPARSSPSGSGPAAGLPLEARHHFHHRYRQRFLYGIAVAAVLLAVALAYLPGEALRLYSILGTLLFAYFLLIHARPMAIRRLPKELAVGIFFSAAIFIPTVARRPDLRLWLMAPALLFATVCTLNCLFLYAWEHPNGSDDAHWTTALATRHLVGIGIVGLLLCGIVAVVFAASYPPADCHATRLSLACALSITILLGLHHQRARLHPIHLRASADLALLTPLLWVLM